MPGQEIDRRLAPRDSDTLPAAEAAVMTLVGRA